MRQSTTPLILLPAEPSSDALAAGLALLLVLEKLGKTAKIVSPNFTLPPGHSFLPKNHVVETQLTSLRHFIITVDVSRTKLDELSYDIQGDRLAIHLSPKQGFYEAKDVTTSSGSFAYDLIIALDLSSLDSLGALYHDNTEFFYQVPILNIDHHSENSRYGHTNVVDVVASSVSEIIFEIVQALGREQMDEQVATSLLTGIISKTKIFQNQRVTPRSLAIASHLMSAGARREDIVRHLYQTKTLATLRLWGLALGRLQTAKENRLVWTTITAHDLQATHTTVDDATGVLDELMTEAATAEVTCLFIETEQGVAVHGVYQSAMPPTNLPAQLVVRGSNYLSGIIPGDFSTVVAATIRQLSSGVQ